MLAGLRTVLEREEVLNSEGGRVCVGGVCEGV